VSFIYFQLNIGYTTYKNTKKIITLKSYFNKEKRAFYLVLLNLQVPAQYVITRILIQEILPKCHHLELKDVIFCKKKAYASYASKAELTKAKNFWKNFRGIDSSFFVWKCYLCATISAIIYWHQPKKTLNLLTSLS